MSGRVLLEPKQIRGLRLCDRHMERYALVFYGKGERCPACLAESLEQKIENTKQTVRLALRKIDEMQQEQKLAALRDVIAT